MGTKKVKTAIGGVVCLLGLAGTACVSTAKPAPVPQAAGPATTPVADLSATRHSIQAQQLRALMKVISMTASDHAPGTLPSDVESPASPASLGQSYEQAIILSQALTTAADRIPFAIEGKTLSEETRSGFLKEAGGLKQAAVELHENAKQKKAEAMARSLDRVNASCVNCHTKYRDLTGLLDFPRASRPSTNLEVGIRDSVAFHDHVGG